MKGRTILVGLWLALGCKADLKTGPHTGPAAVAALRGNGQTGEVATTLPVRPAVLVTTESGDPAEGAIVVFEVAAGGGSLAASTDTTGPDGVAEAGDWTLGTAAGSNRVTARSAGLTGSPVEFTATARPGPPAMAELVAAPPPVVASGLPFAIQPVVQLEDVYGNPDLLAGSVVTAEITEGAGAVLKGDLTAVTDSFGTARFTDLRLEGAVGDYTLSFLSPPLPAVSASTHIDPGSPATVTVQSGNNQQAQAGSALPVNPAVLVRDAFDNPVAGVIVSFAVTAGGGSVAQGQGSTDAQGIASSGTWTLGPAAGGNTLSATVAGIPPVIFNATGTAAPPGPPASITKVSGDNQSAAAGSFLAESLVVVVRDGNGTAIPGAAVSWSVLSGGGALSSASTQTDNAGRARVRWTLGVLAGANSVRAAVGGLNTTFTATGLAGAASRLRMVVQPGGGPSGGLLAPQPVVGLEDQHGNPVAQGGVVVSASLGQGSGLLAGASATTNAAGLATFTGLGVTGTIGPRSLVFAAPGLNSVASGTFTLTAGAAALLVKESGDNQAAQVSSPVPVNPSVRVTDLQGNPVAGVVVSFAVSAGGGSVAQGQGTTDAQGLATGGTWTLGATPGPNALTASATGLTGSPAIFAATAIAQPPGAPASITRISGNGQSRVVGTPADSLVVSVRDANGLGVPGVAVAWTVLGGGGSLSTAATTTDAGGLTGTLLTLGTVAGANAVRATAAGFSTTFNLTGLAGPAATLVLDVQPGGGPSGGLLAPQPVVSLVDQFGNPVAQGGITVTAAIATGGGALSGGSAITSGSGVAAFTALGIAGSTGPRTLAFSAPGISGVTSGTITITAGSAAILQKNAGDNQSAQVSTAVPVNPSVRVTDLQGNPVAGLVVSFAVSAGGGSVAQGQGTTDAQGIASSGAWTLGPAAGANTLTATALGLSGSPAVFAATGTAQPPGPIASISRISGNNQNRTVGTAADSLVVAVRDASGTGLSGVTVTWTILGGGGSLSSASSLTDAAGLAGTVLTLGTTAGPNAVQASAGGFSTTFNLTGIAGPPATLSIHAGNNQSGTVGQVLPVAPAVRVEDASGNPVAGVLVAFAVTGGGGSVPLAQAATDSLGVSSPGSWTLGATAGPNTLTATAAGLAGSPASFTATGTTQPPGPPASIAKISGDQQTVIAGEVAESLVVQVRDGAGLGVPGVAVTWTVLGGGGSLSSTSVVTDVGGLAAVEWTIGPTAGANAARATAAGFNATFNATGIAGPAVVMARSQGNNQSAPAGSAVAVNPTVVVRDGHGNPVAGVAVTFAITAGGGSIQSGTAISNALGLASGGTWTLGPSAGINTLTASSPGLAGSPADFTATGTPTNGPPAAILIVSGNTQSGTVGTALAESLVVRVVDGNGTGVPGVDVDWAVTGGAGTITPLTATTDLTGLAGSALVLGTAAGAVTIEASVGGLVQAFTATALPGSATQLQLVAQPASGASGVPFSPQPLVRLADQHGNLVVQAGVLVTAAIGSGGGSLLGTAAIPTDGAGSAVFTDLAVLGLVGSRTLVFTAPGLAGAATPPLSIGAGPAAVMTKSGGDNQTAPVGSAVAVGPRIVVTDLAGNPVSGVTVDFAVTGGGGSIANASDVTSAQGRASGGTWTLGPVPGTNHVTATSAGLAGSPATFTATGTSTAGAPAAIVKVDGDLQVVPVGTVAPESLLVQVVDAGGGGVPGIAVTWSVTSGGGSVSSGSSTTGASGLAGVAWTMGLQAGPNAVQATAAGFTTNFAATAIAGPATTLLKQAGDNQSASVGTAVPVNPVVQVTDAHGNPVAGMSVSFQVTGGNGAIAFGSDVTNAQGTASGGAWTMGPLPGANTLRASATALPGSPVTFTATGTAAANTRIPLIDMGSGGSYFGHPGRLYPAGNTPPTQHANAGAARARNIRPRSFNGSPNPNGRFVLLSIGLSNTAVEWCTGTAGQPCTSWSFMGQAESDPSVNHQEMVIVNGARPGQEAPTWEHATDPNYDFIRDNILAPQGLSERQVEVVWLKVMNGDPPFSLPSPQADAERLVAQYGNILRALNTRYPNLEMVFMSSRIYAGYATLPLNPEPFAYETGFAVKWVIEAQIDQMANGGAVVDPRAGNLNYNTVAPWVGWGPYMWADGLNPRSDGLTWSISDYVSDLTHPSRSGATKVANMLMSFFKGDPRTGCWFLAGASCP